MKQSRKRTILLRNRNITKDSEGVPVITYNDPVKMTGETWPAGSKLQIATYGDRINSIHNVRIEGKYHVDVVNKVQQYVFDNFILQEGDGVHLFTDSNQDPDYKIVCIKPYNPLYMEVEKL